MKTKIFPLLILFFSLLFAQKEITLDNAIEIAFDNSFSFKTAKYNLESSRKSLEAQKMGLLTSINMNFTLPKYSRRLRNEFNTTTQKDQYFKYESTTMEGALSITQPIIYTNTTISIDGTLSWRDQQNNLTSTKDFYSDVRVFLKQPIFDFNSRAASLRRAEINEFKSSREFTQSEFNLIYNVTQSFYDLYKSKQQMHIAEESVTQNEEQYRTAKNKYMAGLTPEDEMLQQEITLAESKNQLFDAQSAFENAKNNFKHLVGISLSDEITLKADITFEKTNIDPKKALQMALEKRNDILNAQDDMELKELSIEEVSSKKRVKFNLTASYGLNKFDEKFGDILSDMDDSRTAQLTMSVPILDWGKNSREVEAATAQFNLSKERYLDAQIGVTKEIKAIINRIKSAEASVEVLKKSVMLAEKSYKISLERFKVGKITSFDLSMVQSKLTQAKLSNLSALINYKLAIADLERKTLTKFN